MSRVLLTFSSALILGLAIGGCSSGNRRAARGGYGCCAGQAAPPTVPQTAPSPTSVKASNTLCPISGQPIDPSVPTSMYQGRVIGFCCSGCKAEFDANPAAYADKIR